ncbi:MAG TPA: hypothetical protein VKM55_12675 [Candidatus Lokiarchaeia archaeon]|nr:hypothetical protein [Candidatus Lokiarchaeia archaeon]
MEVFKQFAQKNKKIFEDMGVDASHLGFKSIIENGNEMFTYGDKLKALAGSKTFQSSVTPEKTIPEQKMDHRFDTARFTQEVLSKKIWMATIVPVLVAATLYFVLMLVF